MKQTNPDQRKKVIEKIDTLAKRRDQINHSIELLEKQIEIIDMQNYINEKQKQLFASNPVRQKVKKTFRFLSGQKVRRSHHGINDNGIAY